MAVIWRPSKNWKMAATKSKGTVAAMTAGSVVKLSAMRWGKSRRTAEKHAMAPAPRAMAAQPAEAASPGGVAADGLTDTNGTGGRDGEGHHEGEAGAVEGDLVAGERQAADGADEKGDHAEDGDLDEDLAACGGAEESETADAGGFEVMDHAAESVVVAAFDAPERDDHEECEVTAGDGGRKTCAGDSKGGDVDWAPGVAVDEEPVADDVDEVCR